MSYRFNIEKQQLGDLIILLMFDKMFDEEFMNNNEKFNELFDELKGLGLKGKLFDKYFSIDPQIRSKYKIFRREFDNENSQVSVRMLPNETNESLDIYEEIIYECIKRITGKDEPNPEKVKLFTEQVINDILEE
mgnify:CR=1 FL=1